MHTKTPTCYALSMIYPRTFFINGPRNRAQSHRVKALLWMFLIISLVLGVPDSARAVQVHGPPEGLYTHMLAHVFFTAALIFLLILLKYKPIGKGPAWKYFKISLFFFLLWNIDTFIVHWLSLKIPEKMLVTQGALWEHKLLGPHSIEQWIYYIGKNDHLLCVPAMWYLMQSLRHFCIKARQRHQQSGALQS